mmetsp:Transcript_15842/g.40153  ORF Transcript_15842/g.40153 Transcript_15842/m.40153 type:complete len:335 (-) Transcript_15842:1099-2103(-)
MDMIQKGNELVAQFISHFEALFEGKEVERPASRLASGRRSRSSSRDVGAVGGLKVLVPEGSKSIMDDVKVLPDSEGGGSSGDISLRKSSPKGNNEINVSGSDSGGEPKRPRALSTSFHEESEQREAELQNMLTELSGKLDSLTATSQREKSELLLKNGLFEKEIISLKKKLKTNEDKAKRAEEKWSRQYHDLKRSTDSHVAMLEAKLRGDGISAATKLEERSSKERHFVCGDLSLCVNEAVVPQSVLVFIDGVLQRMQSLQSSKLHVLQESSQEEQSRSGTIITSATISKSAIYSKEVGARMTSMRTRVEEDVDRLAKLTDEMEEMLKFLSHNE